MINKLLCWMWGHQFSKVWCYSGRVMYYKRVHTEYIANWRNCIHCGARKHD